MTKAGRSRPAFINPFCKIYATFCTRPGDTGVSHDLRTGQWYVAKVIFRGNNFHVLFGNRELFDAWDDSLPTAGKTGIWTRGATAASFDDFRIAVAGDADDHAR